MDSCSYFTTNVASVNLTYEPAEEEVDTDEKGPYFLRCEVEKAIKEMRNGKATGDNDVPGDVLKLLGEGGYQNSLGNLRFNIKFETCYPQFLGT